MDFTSSTSTAENRTSGNELLQSHVWFSSDLTSVWNRIKYDILRVSLLHVGSLGMNVFFEIMALPGHLHIK